MAKRKGSSAPSCSRARKKVDRGAREVKSAQWLEKLPKEIWEKILDELDENDLFPLALSCRFFRQKQKELVARKTRQSGPESDDSRRALKTNLRQKLEKGQPASADYLWFCRKEKVPKNARTLKAHYTRCLAAFHGHLSLLQKLLKPLKKLPSCFKEYAVRGGQVETLKWLRSEGFHLDEWTCSRAAESGQLEVLKWLRSEGFHLDEWTCSRAAESGHLEVLKWLRNEGCPWNEWTSYWAAVGGRLEVLKWAIDNGCPYKVNYSTRPALQSLGLA